MPACTSTAVNEVYDAVRTFTQQAITKPTEFNHDHLLGIKTRIERLISETDSDDYDYDVLQEVRGNSEAELRRLEALRERNGKWWPE
jgi:hypothetical protein